MHTTFHASKFQVIKLFSLNGGAYSKNEMQLNMQKHVNYVCAKKAKHLFRDQEVAATRLVCAAEELFPGKSAKIGAKSCA